MIGVAILSEAAFLALLGGLCWWAPAVPLAELLAAGVPLGLALRPGLGGARAPGRLAPGRACLLAAFFMVALPYTGGYSHGFSVWMISCAAVIFLAGVCTLLLARREGSLRVLLGSNGFWAALLCLAGVAAMAYGARLILALRSTSPLTPGSIDFLPVMLVAACVWLGLDSHLRWSQRKSGQGFFSWLSGRRQALALLATILVILVRTST